MLRREKRCLGKRIRANKTRCKCAVVGAAEGEKVSCRRTTKYACPAEEKSHSCRLHFYNLEKLRRNSRNIGPKRFKRES